MKLRNARRMLAALACAGLMYAADNGNGNNGNGNDSGETKPDGKGNKPKEGKTNGASSGANGISYHGGPLLLGTVNVYYIWYGNWTNNTATTILTDLATNIGGSPYFKINMTYYNGSGTHVSGAVHYVGSAIDNYSQGSTLNDNSVQTVVSNAISSGKLPKDTTGVYFVLTSADVNESTGFCTQYCGWHWYGTISGSTIKYAFIGNPDRCPNACEWNETVSPNGNPGADGMASILAHELEEAATDPLGNAWYDRRGNENADKCAWTFGTTYTVANGSVANMKLGSRDFLIQRNWVNASGGYCAVAYP